MEFGIEKKVFKLLTDSASNMCKAGRDLNELNEEEEDYDEEHEFDSDCDSVVDSDDEYEDIDDDGAETQVLVGSGIVAGNDIERVDCIAHKINTVIERTLKKKNHFRPMITKSKKLVVSYRRSSKAKSILKKYYEKRLAGFVKTRWWSLLFMLKSVLLALKAPNDAIDKLIDEMQCSGDFDSRTGTSETWTCYLVSCLHLKNSLASSMVKITQQSSEFIRQCWKYWRF